MWIRSQNKTTLIEVKNIQTDDGMILHYNGDETYTMLGEYSTEEKALKVLDMIQNKILENSYFATLHGKILPKDKVFEMPQEDEVE